MTWEWSTVAEAGGADVFCCHVVKTRPTWNWSPAVLVEPLTTRCTVHTSHKIATDFITRTPTKP